MRLPLRSLLLLLALGLPLSAAAADGIRMEGRRIVWQGMLKPEHLPELARLVTQEQAEGLELRDSPGSGAFATTIFAQVRNLMRKRRLPTYARGLCASSCASVFLLGKEPTLLRSLTPGVPTVLMFHALRYKGAPDPALTRTQVADIVSVRGERARHLLLKVADETLPAAAALYVFPKPVDVDAGSSAVLFCDGRPGQKIDTCAPLPQDPLRDLGIINGLQAAALQ